MIDGRPPLRDVLAESAARIDATTDLLARGAALIAHFELFAHMVARSISLRADYAAMDERALARAARVHAFVCDVPFISPRGAPEPSVEDIEACANLGGVEDATAGGRIFCALMHEAGFTLVASDEEVSEDSVVFVEI